jgi:hypothetical protein
MPEVLETAGVMVAAGVPSEHDAEVTGPRLLRDLEHLLEAGKKARTTDSP